MQLVDVSEHPIDRVTADGVVTDGVEYCFDALIFATGFDAMTGSLLKMDILGKAGLTLVQKMGQAGPRNIS